MVCCGCGHSFGEPSASACHGNPFHSQGTGIFCPNLLCEPPEYACLYASRTFHRFCIKMDDALFWCAREPFASSCRFSCRIHIGPARFHEHSYRATSASPDSPPRSHTCGRQMSFDISQGGCSTSPPFQRWTHIAHREANPDGPPSCDVPAHRTWVPVSWNSAEHGLDHAQSLGQVLERLDSRNWRPPFDDASYGSCTWKIENYKNGYIELKCCYPG